MTIPTKDYAIFVSHAYGEDELPPLFVAHACHGDSIAWLSHAEHRRAPTLSEYDRDAN